MTTLKEEGNGRFGTELLKVYSAWNVATHFFFLTFPPPVRVYKPQR